MGKLVLHAASKNAKILISLSLTHNRPVKSLLAMIFKGVRFEALSSAC